MPRNVRNFWVTMNVDGRNAPIAAGPRSADGGFEIHLQIRGDGQVLDGGYILGLVDGKNLKIVYEDNYGERTVLTQSQR